MPDNLLSTARPSRLTASKQHVCPIAGFVGPQSLHSGQRNELSCTNCHQATLQQRTDSQQLAETSPITQKLVQLTALTASCDATMSAQCVVQLFLMLHPCIVHHPHECTIFGMICNSKTFETMSVGHFRAGGWQPVRQTAWPWQHHHVPRRKQQLNNHYWSVHRTYPCWASACWHGALRMAVLEATSTDCVAAARNNADVAAASTSLTEQQHDCQHPC